MKPHPLARTAKLGVATLLIGSLVSGCGLLSINPEPKPEASTTSVTAASSTTPHQTRRLEQPVTLRVLAGSEVKDMAEVLEEATRATNVRVTFDFTGTLDGAETVGAGKAAGKYDAIWFSSNRYLSLIPDASKRIAASTKIMVSPVVLGLKKSVAHRLGWDSKAPTWSDIAKAAEAKKFSYGMTDPSASNSGFSALVGVATALSGGGAALDARRATAVAPDLRRFFSAQTMTAGSSGWLADQFVDKAGKPGGPDGIVNYESVLLGLNADGKLKDSLSIVVPSDGVVTADYPLSLLSGANQQTREAYITVTDWLRTTDAQKLIMAKTSRRPTVPGVKIDARFGDQLLVELPFPGQRAVVDDLITSYLNSIRRATQTIYVLDLSGSMKGRRIEALRTALISLAGGEGKISSSGFAVFRQRETVSLLGYSDRANRPRTFSVPEGGSRRVLADIRSAARDLEVGGNTATYSALEAGYRLAAKQTRSQPGALTSIVLMTDGETNRGASAADFRRFYRGLPPEARAVPTFTVKFGAAGAKPLKALAAMTGGELIEAQGTSLAKAFKEIRAYQ
jgi:Ca-activated chloride channel family protein